MTDATIAEDEELRLDVYTDQVSRHMCDALAATQRFKPDGMPFGEVATACVGGTMTALVLASYAALFPEATPGGDVAVDVMSEEILNFLRDGLDLEFVSSIVGAMAGDPGEAQRFGEGLN